jgi:nitroreductase
MAIRMDAFEALHTTRAMRRLRSDRIPPDDVARIVDAAIRAPAGGGVLRVRFVAVTDDETKAETATIWRRAFALRRASHFDPLLDEVVVSGNEDEAVKLRKLIASSQYLADHLAEAPLILFAFGHAEDEASVLPAMWSACLAARALGIGSTFTRILVRDAREEIERLLGAASSGWALHGVVPMGYPLGRWDVAPRPPAPDACYSGRWGQPVEWSAPPARWWSAP